MSAPLRSIVHDSKVSQSASQLRLFVAVYPPQDMVAALLRGIGRLTLPDHRLVQPEQVHLTVHFVGAVPAAQLDSILESVEYGMHGITPFSLAPDRLITLPERSRKRLVAAEADGPAPLAELHRRLVSRLASNPRTRSVEGFRPHFTLCRFRREVAMAPIDKPIDVGSFDVTAIVLMKSVLTPQGAQHTTVRQFELG